MDIKELMQSIMLRNLHLINWLQARGLSKADDAKMQSRNGHAGQKRPCRSETVSTMDIIGNALVADAETEKRKKWIVFC